MEGTVFHTGFGVFNNSTNPSLSIGTHIGIPLLAPHERLVVGDQIKLLLKMRIVPSLGYTFEMLSNSEFVSSLLHCDCY